MAERWIEHDPSHAFLLFFFDVPEHECVFLLHFQAIYLLANPGGTIKLYVFVAIFGVFMMILAQLPSFHSLWHVNLISLLLCLAYSFCAVAGSIYLGTDSSSWTSTSAAQRGKNPVTSSNRSVRRRT